MSSSGGSWFESIVSEWLNPKLAQEKIEKQKLQEREIIKANLENLSKKLKISEKELRRTQKKYLELIKRYGDKKDKRNMIKYIKLYKQCDSKLDKLSDIIVNVESQILNVKTGDSILDASTVVDNCDNYFNNLFRNVNPDLLEDKLLNIGDKEVITTEMETIMSTPYSNNALSVHEDDDDLIEFANNLLGAMPPPSSDSGNNDIPILTSDECVKLPSVPTSSSSHSIALGSSIKKPAQKIKKKKKITDLDIF